MDQATDSLARWRNNIHLISQLIQNDVSSTKVCFSPLFPLFLFFNAINQVRLFIRRGLSVRYLLPANVVDYIEQNGLYLEDGASPNIPEKEKEKEPVAGGSQKDSPASSLRS